MCNFFRRYIHRFAMIARPIHDTLKGKQVFQWTPEATEAMEELKKKLISPPILVHYDSRGRLTIRCDASGYGVGAVLMQDHDDPTRKGVIAYTSRTLLQAENNYATTHKECLAVIHSVKHWRHYLYGIHFTIITDHHALCWLMRSKDHTGRLMRWSLILQEYQFTIQYESGRVHNDADCLSRLPIEAEKSASDECDIPTWPINRVTAKDNILQRNENLILPTFDVPEEQLKDPFAGPIIKLLTEACTAKVRKKYKHFKLENKTLYKRSRRDKNQYLLVLPESMKDFVLKEAHDKPTGGHFGFKRTMSTIAKRFFWTTLDQDVKAYVKSCDPCQRKKSSTNKEGLMIPMPIPKQIFEIIGVDLMGPLPQSSHRSLHILVVTDYLSKYVITQAMKATTTEKIIEILRRQIFYTHGLPRVIITDNGSNLTSSSMRDTLKLFNIIQKTTSPYRPQTNGQTERYNRVLGTQLSIFAEENPRKWDQYLEALTFAYNTTIHASHLTTPFQLVFGREPIKPIDLITNQRPVESSKDNELVTDLEKIEAARILARKLIKQSQQSAKVRYDKGRSLPSYKINDLVLRKRQSYVIGESRKFYMPWQGPFKIIRILSDVNYQIVNLKDPEEQYIAHINQIKPYNQRLIASLEGAEGTQEATDPQTDGVEVIDIDCIQTLA